MTVQGFTDLGSTNADNLFAGEFPRVSLLVHEQRRKTIIAFILVPQVKMPKITNFASESEYWQEQVPDLILQNWKDDE